MPACTRSGGMVPPDAARDDDIRRLAEEAARAARAAEEAVARLERDQPSRFEQVVNAVANLLRTLLDALFGRLRAEVEGARRAGEELVARVLLAISRSVQHLGQAVMLAFATALFLAIGFIVLTIALVAWLNARLGDPWGTFAAAGAFLLAGALTAAAARAKVRAVSAEARALSPPRLR